MRRVMQIDAQISFLISEDRRNYAKLDDPLRRVAILGVDAAQPVLHRAGELGGIIAHRLRGMGKPVQTAACHVPVEHHMPGGTQGNARAVLMPALRDKD